MPFTLLSVESQEDPRWNDVRQWLRDYNWSVNRPYMEKWQAPENAPQPLNLLAVQDATVVGGLLAETQFAWLKVSIMAVHPARRAQGIGSALLTEALRTAAERSCRHAYVDTMEYQACSFYLKRGFSVAGKIADWDSHGHAKFFLTKDLRFPHED